MEEMGVYTDVAERVDTGVSEEFFVDEERIARRTRVIGRSGGRSAAVRDALEFSDLLEDRSPEVETFISKSAIGFLSGLIPKAELEGRPFKPQDITYMIEALLCLRGPVKRPSTGISIDYRRGLTMLLKEQAAYSQIEKELASNSIRSSFYRFAKKCAENAPSIETVEDLIHLIEPDYEIAPFVSLMKTARKVERGGGASEVAPTQRATDLGMPYPENYDDGSLDDAPWQQRALCAQTDPEVFFPEKGGSTREAKKICSACEVKLNCLQSAVDNDERFGIWGGLAERERRKLKRRTR